MTPFIYFCAVSQDKLNELKRLDDAKDLVEELENIKSEIKHLTHLQSVLKTNTDNSCRRHFQRHAEDRLSSFHSL